MRLGSSRFRESAIVQNAQPEPLDDRAQLTAPREWAVLACLGLALAAFLLWGVFGSVERTLRLDGVLALSGGAGASIGDPAAAGVVSGDGGHIGAVAFAAPEDAWLLDSGMTVRVTVASPGGDRTLRGELAAVSPRTEGPPEWLARARPEMSSPGRGHVLRVALSRPPDSAMRADAAPARSLVDGTPCRIDIVLERTSPFGLLIRS